MPARPPRASTMSQLQFWLQPAALDQVTDPRPPRPALLWQPACVRDVPRQLWELAMGSDRPVPGSWGGAGEGAWQPPAQRGVLPESQPGGGGCSAPVGRRGGQEARWGPQEPELLGSRVSVRARRGCVHRPGRLEGGGTLPSHSLGSGLQVGVQRGRGPRLGSDAAWGTEVGVAVWGGDRRGVQLVAAGSEVLTCPGEVSAVTTPTTEPPTYDRLDEGPLGAPPPPRQPPTHDRAG